MNSRNDSLTILIVDPRVIVRKGLSQIIEHRFPEAHLGEADDLDGATKMVRRISWNVIFLNLPFRELVLGDPILKLREWVPDAKVLTLGEARDEGNVIRILRNGASGYVSLYADSDELTEAINDVLAGKVHVSPSLRERIMQYLIEGEEEPTTKVLSKRESEVLEGLASGHTSQELANEMGLSATTISTFRTRLMKKLGLKSTADIVHYAIDNGILSGQRRIDS